MATNAAATRPLHEQDPSVAATQHILVELVNEEGIATGTSEKIAAHQSPGRLHRAFSVFLLDPHGQLLLQRRATSKYHSPGVWSNTCCGHPSPAEPPFIAATRRIVAELGVPPAVLSEAGTVTYDHADPISGLVEREYNHLFTGLIRQTPRPAPEEVSEVIFADPDELARLRQSHPFSTWFDTVFEAVRPQLRELTVASAWLPRRIGRSGRTGAADARVQRIQRVRRAGSWPVPAGTAPDSSLR
jgi:isopentenyl-diphosphate delta-isomerase